MVNVDLNCSTAAGTKSIDFSLVFMCKFQAYTDFCCCKNSFLCKVILDIPVHASWSEMQVDTKSINFKYFQITVFSDTCYFTSLNFIFRNDITILYNCNLHSVNNNEWGLWQYNEHTLIFLNIIWKTIPKKMENYLFQRWWLFNSMDAFSVLQQKCIYS